MVRKHNNRYHMDYFLFLTIALGRNEHVRSFACSDWRTITPNVPAAHRLAKCFSSTTAQRCF